ncbi:MAG: hypothetical protein AAF999_06830 [Pseudomonadota bacterium]
MNDLDAALLAAHEAQDAGLLIRLYQQAAAQTSDPDAAGFYLTHAYVFALEAGDARADALRQRLIEMGRETQD